MLGKKTRKEDAIAPFAAIEFQLVPTLFPPRRHKGLLSSIPPLDYRPSQLPQLRLQSVISKWL